MCRFWLVKDIRWLSSFMALFCIFLQACSAEEATLEEGALKVVLHKQSGLTISDSHGIVLSSYAGEHTSGDELRQGDAYGAFAGAKTLNRDVEEIYGSFRFEDSIEEFFAFKIKKIKEKNGFIEFEFEEGGKGKIEVAKNTVRLHFEPKESKANRLAMNFSCKDSDRFFGLGAQVSAEHRGHRIPIWVSEQGNGKSDQGEPPQVFGLTGGHYDSYSPIPFTLMNRPLGLELDTVHRSEFELCAEGGPIRLEIQDSKFALNIYVGDDVGQVLGAFTAATGRPNVVSRWSYGPWVDSFGGPDEVLRVANVARENGVPASALWAEDWLGIQRALGGEHLTYNWEEDAEFYPDLEGVADALHQQGIRFLTYFNPMIPNNTELYQEGLEGGYLVADEQGSVIDLEFPFGAPPAYFDMSTQAAKEWYWGYLGRAVDKGVDGWMSDYGESLPYEAKMADGRSGAETHNVYPLEWNGSSLEFWQNRSPEGDFAFFTRSGYTGIAAHTHIHWFGDQITSFDRNDGLGSVLPLYLSSSLSGMFLSHSDIGGYTSVGSVKRTYELWARWLEIEAFTPFMRTHHTSNPDDNLQWHSSDDTIALFKRYGTWHQRLLPYFMELVDAAAGKGLPPIRPLWWGAENASDLYDVEDQILIGENLLLAPILAEGGTERALLLPAGSQWRRWSTYAGDFGELLDAGDHTLNAEVEETILFVKAGAVVPVLSRVYDTLAPERSGDEYTTEVDSTPENFNELTLLVGAGADGSGTFSQSDFGTIDWDVDSDAVFTNSCDSVKVDGVALDACTQGGSISCFLARSIELRGDFTSAKEIECVQGTHTLNLRLQVSGLETIFVEIR